MRSRRPHTIVGLALIAAIPAGCIGIGGGPLLDIPRPRATRSESPSAGRPTACTLSFPVHESLGERVAGLRSAGLFADRPGVSDAVLASEVEAAIIDSWGGMPDWDDGFLELVVAEQDDARVWWQDLEADVGAGNDVYVETLEAWADISVGAFEPVGITETWASETGPVTLAFELDGVPRTIRAIYQQDWIDMRVLGAINALIEDAGRQFDVVTAFDQSAVVVALTPTERAALEARGWCFLSGLSAV